MTFRLDPFQAQALAALERGASVLVAAPTGAGKTVVAELAIERALAAGKRALYASPIKALSNQKYRDFALRFGAGRVGILTGDVQDNPAAAVLVLTTEILHNMVLRGDLDRLRDVACLVFDEFHYLSDPDRGRVWEQTILLCPRSIQMVCLSATLPNVDQLAAWLRAELGNVEVVVETRRSVPLSWYYFAASALHPLFPVDDRLDGTLKRFDRQVSPSVVDLLDVLLREALTPVLYFVFSRREAERQALQAADWLEQHGGLAGDDLLDSVDRRLFESGQGQALQHCLQRGVAFHHGGLLPDLKVLVEDLFGQGRLALLCATETFAVGLNMPARTVALSRITKFDGRGHRELTARELQQMAGRAGRRGKDERGHVVLLADARQPFAAVARLATAPLEPVQSAFSVDYPTFLNLMAAYGDDAPGMVVGRSFALHQVESELSRLDSMPVASSRKQQQETNRRVAALQAALTTGRHQKELAVMRTVLVELGYGSDAPKATLLRGLFDDRAILLAETLTDARFAALDPRPEDLAELTGWFAAAGRRRPARTPAAKANPRLRQLLEDVTARVQRAERGGGLLLTQSVVPAYPDLVKRAMAGEDAAVLCRSYQIHEGDLTQHFERLNQLLTQLARASASLPAIHSLAAAALRQLAGRGITDVAEDA